MFLRKTLDLITSRLNKGKVIILIGARQVGKTTLTKDLLALYPAGKTLVLNGDNYEAQRLSKMEGHEILELIADYDCLLIDEAHKVSRIGDIIKSMVDHYGKDKQIILTGSSTVNLIDSTTEPLTGRKRVFELYPISLPEYAPEGLESSQELHQLMLYGLYPEVLNEDDPQDKLDALMELAESSLYRDVLDVTGARASGDLVALLRYLASNIGETISINDASIKLSIDRRTIDRYIDLLTKSFIVYTLMPYSRAGSIRRSYKVYFWDTGIRNALLEDFTPLDQRQDTDRLWQNFVISERLKAATYSQQLAQHYFWRSYDGAEVDLVEQRGQQIHGYRISWDGKNVRESQVFNDLSPTSQQVIEPDTLSLMLDSA
ncbi:MAG: ATP-binding protein [Patescibacteria group bacterium]